MTIAQTLLNEISLAESLPLATLSYENSLSEILPGLTWLEKTLPDLKCYKHSNSGMEPASLAETSLAETQLDETLQFDILQNETFANKTSLDETLPDGTLLDKNLLDIDTLPDGTLPDKLMPTLPNEI